MSFRIVRAVKPPKPPRPVTQQHLWPLIQRVLAYYGPLSTKELYDNVAKISASDTKGLSPFKDRVLMSMKERGLISIKSNEDVMREATRMLAKAR